jgi:elongation factor P
MPLVGANELKKKMFILVDGQPYLVLEVTFASPTARSASAMVRARLRHLLTGAVQDKNFKTGEKFQEADVENVPVSFLYSDPDALYFMDDTSYEQFSFQREKIKDIAGLFKEGLTLQATKYNGQYVSLQLPVYVELKVVYAEPAVRGDSSGSVQKKAKLETGLEVEVPIYIKEGDTVRVNSETLEVPGRA